MAKDGTIVVVDDNKNVLTALKLLLTNYFEKVVLLSSPNTLLHQIEEQQPHVILLDMNFSSGINSGNEGLFWLREVKKYNPNIPIVLFTAYADIDLAVKALKEGATDFVVKPWDNAKLLATLHSAKALNDSRKKVQQLKDRQQAFHTELNTEQSICWGESPAMVHLHNIITKVARTSANILITGENGTGKEVVARKIHNLSLRASNSLVTVDMGAIVETLFESELFGHTKGSFTDAKADRIGKFELADQGTLFLDEIGNLDVSMQAKLLSALQTRTVTRVGSNQPIPINIRLICATNTDLPLAVKEGAFREDLFYRINTIELRVPPLRERVEDIPLLAQFFLNRYAKKYHNRTMNICTKAINKLQEYNWPGNVRELQHAIEKAVILSDKPSLEADDFILRMDTSLTQTSMDGLTLQDMEKKMIEQSLKVNEGNISAVASELGITRPTLYNKMKKYQL
ncbi:sigma-54 dependent transcriptional regulator [Bacteroides sp.]|uniref:sigma-54-dependent transcriptional regulator n=1 Tax=Bacteroides sp. TaxID=29523 RepID=UPI002588BE9A|nr:sigma-54 dependent transcriptional regulator [Bacteroides sp.]